MKRLLITLALLPALAVAAPPDAPGRGPQGAGPDDQARMQQAQKRMRVARTIAFAEALDLDEAGAMRVRDVMARFDERRAPLRKQIMDNVRVLRDAARGDKAAGAQVDQAVQRLRDARTKLHALNGELFQQLTQGLSPEKKAKAALFLARFEHRAHGMMHRRHGGWGGGGPGHAMMMGEDPPGPGGGGEGCALFAAGAGPVDEWFADE